MGPIEDLGNRLRKRARELRRWARRQGISCYRIYECDLPDHPLIVDWYEGSVVVATLERKRDETAAAAAAWEEAVMVTVTAALEVDPTRVFQKQRRRQRGMQQYERLEATGHTQIVTEAGLRFEVNLSDYLDTGLFLDHRPTRARVGTEAAGLDVLNCFCYTGAFTVHAAAGGARSTCSVDLSRTYLDWTARNLRLNGIDGDEHELIQADCLAWLAAAHAQRRRFDLIICDPPTFSNSKRMAQDFVIDADWPQLLGAVCALLRPGGHLYFSTNRRGFSLDGAQLFGCTLSDLSQTSVPQDFRNRRIHRCWLLRKD